MARELLDTGSLGRVRMIQALNYTDFMYRPRRREELEAELGGGVIFNQAAHQIDIVRLLVDSPVVSLRAQAKTWDPARPVEGAYMMLMWFENGAMASLTYSGYAHFDSDEWCNGFSEQGVRKSPETYGQARARLARLTMQEQEARTKLARNYGGPDWVSTDLDAFEGHQHFGPLLVSAEKGDLRPLPDALCIYEDASWRKLALPDVEVPRSEVVDELYNEVVLGESSRFNGEWGRETLRVCLALQQSSRENREIRLLDASVSVETEDDDEIGKSIRKHWQQAVPNDRLAHLVKDTGRSFQRLLEPRLAAHDVLPGHWTYLRILWEQDGLTQKALSAEAGVAEPSTAAALRGMESCGYITRRHLDGNRKNLHVFLTEQGRSLKDRLVPLAEDINAQAVSGLTDAEVAVLRQSLLRVLGNLLA